ncbi:FixH family protein [Fimbriimonas ginsengisoli]|uniref:FixH family protein n=1 Tax=Fimbriimonas ginsengisoli TaxID=1005039 RepID=UPI001D0DDD25|nr:FixH family protein [Fimbriimonas ginsengisoli]
MKSKSDLAKKCAVCKCGVAASACRPAKPAKPATKAQVGKYLVELRVPEEGLFAGEQVDVEFRLSDTTHSDPIEGKRGVPNAQPRATVTMPSMPGMPVVRPKIHSEGVPGDYGVELFFPHGGTFQVGLLLTPPGEKPLRTSFSVNVNDAEARRSIAKPKPYSVEMLDFPKDARAGQPIDLHLEIKDTKTDQIVRDFDVAHTKLIHLIVVSKDLGWFAHEHPEQQADGSFRLPQTFPAGGDYLVFADVAPKDKGSQVISTSVHVAGPGGNWSKKLAPTTGKVAVDGIVAEFQPTETPIPIGKTTVVSFHLRDEATGQPVNDLEPYLGAHGHLMIIHQDGQAFVHSHPAEDAAAAKLIRQGEVRFTARFPKPGIYKAWAQFQRHGKVVTLPFVFEVK